MSFAALSKARPSARSPETTTSPMKRCGGCFKRRASKERGERMTNPQPAPDTQPSPAILSAFKRTQERNRKLEAFIRWEDALFSNPHLSGNHKIEIRATRRAV